MTQSVCVCVWGGGGGGVGSGGAQILPLQRPCLNIPRMFSETTHHHMH